MTKQHLSTLVFTIPLACTNGCTAPDDVKTPTSMGPMDGADEADDELPPVDPESQPVPMPSGSCVTAEKPPYEGIRHHCGGTMDISISGDALGSSVDEDLSINFGPGIPGDSYEHPLVAACCGEYDFEQLASSQPAYWSNCLYDAVQQSCASLPYYLWDMAANAKAANKLVLADQLTKLGNDLGTSDKQYACIEALFGSGPGDNFNVITGNEWNPAYDVWINVEFLEILEVALPEDPADWEPCKSIYENEENVIPDMHPGPLWDTLGFDSGALELSGTDIVAKFVPDDTSELLLGFDSSSSLMLGAMQLHGGPVIVEGVEIDRWRLGSLRTEVAREGSDGSFSIPAGAMSLVAAIVVDDDTLSVSTTNAMPIVLRESADGWEIEPFSLVYTQDDGDVWTLDTTALRFGLR